MYGISSCVSFYQDVPIYDLLGIPLLQIQEEKEVPSMQASHDTTEPLHFCAALFHYSCQPQKRADRRRAPAFPYHLPQKVWLSSKNLPLQVESSKPAPNLIGPFQVDQNMNPADREDLKLPSSLKVHLTFHLSLLKPVASWT